MYQFDQDALERPPRQRTGDRGRGPAARCRFGGPRDRHHPVGDRGSASFSAPRIPRLSPASMRQGRTGASDRVATAVTADLSRTRRHGLTITGLIADDRLSGRLR